MSMPFDATLKEIVSQAPADFRRPFRLPDLEPVTALNVDLSTITAATDVALGFGAPLREIVDLNFQSGADPSVMARLHLYNAALHLKFAVPVRSILVLLRPKAEVPGLNGNLSYTSGGRRVSFEYEVIRLWKEPVERFIEGSLGSLPLATLCKLPEGKRTDAALRDVVRAIDHRRAVLPDHATAVRLMTASYVLANLRIPRENLAKLFSGVTIMHKLPAYDEYVLDQLLPILRKLGEKKFKATDRKTESALKALDDPERVERMIEAILDVGSWKELLAVK